MPDTSPETSPQTSMIINYVPGEECRIAIACDGNLEEFHAERTDAVSRVNNIYVGRVTNVESGIQAAFVDFGLEENGFLHVSDLHPRYFQEDDATERVGKKTPRRERPPIQACLKRGQEVIVQVIKEGVGTKGPTLTSYLSIPGRYLVMMPQMDKVGVSRKVEDEEERIKMRDILNQLGFILRTAGFDRTKTDLKRDLAYLQRLWKDMEANRKKAGKRTRLLYSESDLLVRALRDLVTPDITRIIIDDEGALARAAQFMKIVAPRSSVKVLRYTGRRPIFHAFGIEQQLALSHAREVPLPSGGRLVIDETEAIVAIDVNSGKSRSAKDAETNAYKTNIEAVEAICRQLRLRDIGGIVINDLIDMRQAKNRKAIEGLFRDRLKRDRAKTTIAPISPFGILEMTRQRMRGSLRSQHYTECPTCHGKGLVQRPSSVASDALREVAVLLEHEEVDRVELVVSGRIAGELLSNRRGSLNRIERSLGKQVEVRVSDTLGLDRFSIYAYDRNGADVGPEKLPKHRSPETELEVVETAAAEDGWALDPAETAAETDDDAPLAPDAPTPHPIELEVGEEMQSAEGETKKKRRRRRRKKKPGEGEATGETTGQTGGQTGGQTAGQSTPADAPSTDRDPDAEERAGEPGAAEGDGTKKKRRRRRRKKKSGEAPAGVDRAMGAEPGAQPTATDDDADEDASEHEAESDEPATDTPPGDDHPDAQPKKKRRRSRRKKKPAGDMVAEGAEPTDEPATQQPAERASEQASEQTGEQDDAGPDGPTKVKKGRRRKKPGERSASSVEPRPAEASAPHAAPRSAAQSPPQTPPRTSPPPAPRGAPERTPAPVTLPKKPRTLYGASRRRLGPSGIPRSRDE